MPMMKISEEELNLKVAKLCGWEIRPFTDPDGTGIICWNSKLDETRPPEDDGIRFKLPDYASDLNDCHEMEKMHPNLSEYIMLLESIGDGDGMCATARQRCEAFVMTLGGNYASDEVPS